jgi:hypothetical protein
MSTLTSIILATVSFAAHPLTATAQTDIGPVKLTGSATVVVDTYASSRSLGKRTIFYNYTVELNQSSAFDTTVYFTDTTHALHYPGSVVILAGQTSKNITVYGLSAPSSDTFTAYNANRSVSIPVATVWP